MLASTTKIPVFGIMLYRLICLFAYFYLCIYLFFFFLGAGRFGDQKCMSVCLTDFKFTILAMLFFFFFFNLEEDLFIFYM